MDNSKSTAVGWVGVVIALIACATSAWAVFGGSSMHAGEVRNQADYYPNGIHLGNQAVTTSYGFGLGVSTADSIQIGKGQNQASWLNTKPTTAYVCEGYAALAGTASSTVKLNVGTSTKATQTDQFTLSTAPMWSEFIDALSISTSTANVVVGDNMVNHKSNKSACLAVPTNTYFVATISSWCTSNGACETATSSNRGWTTLTIPFNYTY